MDPALPPQHRVNRHGRHGSLADDIAAVADASRARHTITAEGAQIMDPAVTPNEGMPQQPRSPPSVPRSRILPGYQIKAWVAPERVSLHPTTAPQSLVH